MSAVGLTRNNGNRMRTLTRPLSTAGPLLLLVACHLCAYAEVQSEEPSDLKSLLAHAVLAKGQSLDEVKRFCDGRIIPMPRDITWSAWQHEAEPLRQKVLDDSVFRGVPPAWRGSTQRVEWFDTIPAEGYSIKKLRYEALPGLWIPALLYEPNELKGRVPVVPNVNGHDSKGKTAPYKQIRCINLAKRGMIALNAEWLGMGQLQGDGFAHGRMNQLDLCGTSG